jgi:hypothetical protein
MVYAAQAGSLPTSPRAGREAAPQIGAHTPTRPLRLFGVGCGRYPSCMLFAVSPYHLTTREPAAVAAFLLARGVVTLLPAPFEGAGREQVEAAATAVPRYLEFMKSWQWTMPLWEDGVIRAGLDGEDAAADVRAVCESIEADERFSRLRVFMRPELWESEEGYLEAVARDLLKGGPDPAISVPVAAGIDRFATRHGLAVARSAPSSVVQRAEERLGERLFACAIPVLLQASGEKLLEARELLAEELDELRDAIDELAELDVVTANGELDHARARLVQAARAYTVAFEENRELLTEVDDGDDLHVVTGVVSLTGMMMPSDAVLTSSMTALRAISPALGPAPSRATNLPALADAAVNVRFLTVVVKVIGKRARR